MLVKKVVVDILSALQRLPYDLTSLTEQHHKIIQEQILLISLLGKEINTIVPAEKGKQEGGDGVVKRADIFFNNYLREYLRTFRIEKSIRVYKYLYTIDSVRTTGNGNRLAPDKVRGYLNDAAYRINGNDQILWTEFFDNAKLGWQLLLRVWEQKWGGVYENPQRKLTKAEKQAWDLYDKIIGDAYKLVIPQYKKIYDLGTAVLRRTIYDWNFSTRKITYKKTPIEAAKELIKQFYPEDKYFVDQKSKEKDVNQFVKKITQERKEPPNKVRNLFVSKQEIERLLNAETFASTNHDDNPKWTTIIHAINIYILRVRWFITQNPKKYYKMLHKYIINSNNYKFKIAKPYLFKILAQFPSEMILITLFSGTVNINKEKSDLCITPGRDSKKYISDDELTNMLQTNTVNPDKKSHDTARTLIKKDPVYIKEAKQIIIDGQFPNERGMIVKTYGFEKGPSLILPKKKWKYPQTTIADGHHLHNAAKSVINDYAISPCNSADLEGKKKRREIKALLGLECSLEQTKVVPESNPVASITPPKKVEVVTLKTIKEDDKFFKGIVMSIIMNITKNELASAVFNLALFGDYLHTKYKLAFSSTNKNICIKEISSDIFLYRGNDGDLDLAKKLTIITKAIKAIDLINNRALSQFSKAILLGLLPINKKITEELFSVVGLLLVDSELQTRTISSVTCLLPLYSYYMRNFYNDASFWANKTRQNKATCYFLDQRLNTQNNDKNNEFTEFKDNIRKNFARFSHWSDQRVQLESILNKLEKVERVGYQTLLMLVNDDNNLVKRKARFILDTPNMAIKNIRSTTIRMALNILYLKIKYHHNEEDYPEALKQYIKTKKNLLNKNNPFNYYTGLRFNLYKILDEKDAGMLAKITDNKNEERTIREYKYFSKNNRARLFASNFLERKILDPIEKSPSLLACCLPGWVKCTKRRPTWGG